MFTNAKIENFRCFRDVSVNLKPLTVLIGNNDTGKSAFLDALLIPNRGKSFEIPDDIWCYNAASKDASINIIFREGIDTSASYPFSTSYVRTRNPKLKSEPPHRGKYAKKFDLPHNGPKMVSSGGSDTSGLPKLTEDGSNVPALLDFFLRRDRDRFFAFIKAAVEHIPGLSDIEIHTPQPDQRRIDLVIDNGFVIPADQASVGVRLILFFLALAYHPEPPELILIEEPERGVHPKRLSEIIGLLRGLTTGEHSPIASQIIMTTHSPYLLDCIDIETDGVLIFQREPDGSRSVRPADAERLKIFLDEFHLGEVWFNEGEEGMVHKT